MTGRARLAAGLVALLLAGCSSGSPPPAQEDARNVVAAPSPPSAELRSAESKPPPFHATARRCGWLSNPTPGNWWFRDRDGEWILGVQGGYQAPGLDEMPDMSAAGWEEVNGHYGYGCACITRTVDPVTGRAIRIADATSKPLKQCSADRALPRPQASGSGE
jgi:hypothetical protein